MWGVFIITEFKLTPKGQVECARRQDVKRLRPRVFLSVCDRFNMRYGFGPAACSSVSWCFISIMGGEKKSWGQACLTVGPSGLSRWFQSAKDLFYIDMALEIKREKNVFL